MNDGGPAFPQPLVENQGRIDTANAYGEGGMTLRDYFAAKAMQGDLAAESEEFNTRGSDGKSREQKVAEAAYRFADAMIEARKEPKA